MYFFFFYFVKKTAQPPESPYTRRNIVIFWGAKLQICANFFANPPHVSTYVVDLRKKVKNEEKNTADIFLHIRWCLRWAYKYFQVLGLQKNASVLRNFCTCVDACAHIAPCMYIWHELNLNMQRKLGGWVIRVTALKLVILGLNPASEFFFCTQNFFCANSTHASNLCKFANPYNKRNIDAQSAHIVVLRRYCAK